MAVGDFASGVVQSYVALGVETTLGTYASATTSIEALSWNVKVDIASEKIDSMSVNRGFNRRVQLDKTVTGTLETYCHPQEDVLLIANAMGGGIVTSSLSAAATHSITAGNFANSQASLSFNVRKGDTLTWRYMGGRVNQWTLTGNVGEPLKCSYDLVFRDATQQTDNIAGILSISSVLPYTFVQGVFRYAASEAAAATTTVEEPITGFELSLNNNIKSDKDARELGTNTASVLPGTRREINFKITQRFDTTTTWLRFTQATQGAVELFFRGATITTQAGGDIYYDMTIRLPTVFQNTPDPELGGAGDIVMSEIEYDVLIDNPNTTTGKDIGVTITNNITSY